MHFTILGKEISINIPGNRPPVESRVGVVWENAIINSQPTYNSTVKTFNSWCNFLSRQSKKTFLGSNSLSTPKRSLVLQGANEDEPPRGPVEAPPPPPVNEVDHQLFRIDGEEKVEVKQLSAPATPMMAIAMDNVGEVTEEEI